MTTQSSILAWEIPWTEELAGYSPQGHKRLNMTQQLNNNNKYSIVHMYYIFFIQSSIKRQLGCLCIGCCKQCYCKHWDACIFLNQSFLQIPAQEWDDESYGYSIFSCIRNLRAIVHNGCTSLHPSNSVGGFPFLHPSPAFVICRQTF